MNIRHGWTRGRSATVVPFTPGGHLKEGGREGFIAASVPASLWSSRHCCWLVLATSRVRRNLRVDGFVLWPETREMKRSPAMPSPATLIKHGYVKINARTCVVYVGKKGESYRFRVTEGFCEAINLVCGIVYRRGSLSPTPRRCCGRQGLSYGFPTRTPRPAVWWRLELRDRKGMVADLESVWVPRRSSRFYLESWVDLSLFSLRSLVCCPHGKEKKNSG